MFILGVTPFFDVPIFYSAHNVGFIGRAYLQFDFIAFQCKRILEQQVEASSTRLRPLPVPKNEVAKVEDSRIGGYPILNPPFRQNWASAKCALA